VTSDHRLVRPHRREFALQLTSDLFFAPDIDRSAPVASLNDSVSLSELAGNQNTNVAVQEILYWVGTCWTNLNQRRGSVVTAVDPKAFTHMLH
jgi:hypothetical protein